VTEVLRIDHINKTYERRAEMVEALRDVNLSIETGEFVSFVGPSGCGKTTLLKIIDGLIRPTSGRILLDGKELRGVSSDLGFVFQVPNLFPWRSVLANVALGLEAKVASRKEREERARAVLDLVGLGNRADVPPYTLSGGMAQRVGLARALVTEPSVLLMDEPFGQLDRFTRESLQADLARLVARTGATVLFVTHDIEEAIYLSDRVAVFGTDPGRLLDVVDVGLPKPRWEYLLDDLPEALALRNKVRTTLGIRR
jgi:NitT/TauT family transport system ATP-binding protein